MDKQHSAHQFKELYKDLDIDLSALGCVMADVYPITIEKFSEPYEFYTSTDPKKHWIKGWVADKNPHVTLLYGLLSPAKKIAKQIKTVLKGWTLSSVKVESVEYFDSPYPEEEYYCIIAKISLTPSILEAHQRLQFLPHINTFAGYVPHVTLCYIKKDSKQRDALIEALTPQLVGKELLIRSNLNLGDKE
jgi:2'-5' RNA ligase